MIRTFLRTALGRIQNKSGPISLGDATLSTGDRVYAIGDIHGRADLLSNLLDTVLQDSQSGPGRNTLIYLGDYVDRGGQSREVIDLILQFNPKDFTQIYLMGNHEELLLQFLESPEQAAAWLEFGGKETLLSYGVSIPLGVITPAKLKGASERLREALPKAHLQYFEQLEDYYEQGDYFFTHAGIAPNRPLHRQATKDLRWARESFLSHAKLYKKIVVHGHTITETPEFHHNRISIDTGAYHSGHLTCLVLEENTRRILMSRPISRP